MTFYLLILFFYVLIMFFVSINLEILNTRMSMTLRFKIISVILLASITSISASEEQERDTFKEGVIKHTTGVFRENGVSIPEPNNDIQVFFKNLTNQFHFPSEVREVKKTALFLTFKAVEKKRISGDLIAKIPENLEALRALAGDDRDTLQAIENHGTRILQEVQELIPVFNVVRVQLPSGLQQ